MKITVPQFVEIEITSMLLKLPVRYDDEDIPYDFHGRVDDLLTLTVNLDTKKIVNWPQGQTASFYMKVVDGGTYSLLNSCGIQIGREIQDYVPDCVPGNYGDYVGFDIDENGVVTNWPDDANYSEFFSVD